MNEMAKYESKHQTPSGPLDAAMSMKDPIDDVIELTYQVFIDNIEFNDLPSLTQVKSKVHEKLASDERWRKEALK